MNDDNNDGLHQQIGKDQFLNFLKNSDNFLENFYTFDKNFGKSVNNNFNINNNDNNGTKNTNFKIDHQINKVNPFSDSVSENKTEKLEVKQEVYTSAINQLARMQPTLPQTTGAADMDLTAVQSMDWLFKKERIYLLAQFWQQRATLAEKEVNTLKEQLSGANPPPSSAVTSNTTSTSLSSPTAGSAAVTASSPAPTATINLTTTTSSSSSSSSGAGAGATGAAAAAATVPNKISTSLSSNSSSSSSNSSNCSTSNINSNNNTSNFKSNSVAIIQQQQQQSQHLPQQLQINGLSSPSPPLSDCGSTAGSSISTSGGGGINLNNLSSSNKLLLNNIKMEDCSTMITSMTADMKIGEHNLSSGNLNDQKLLNNNNNNNNNNSNNNNNNNNSTSNINNINRSITPNDKQDIEAMTTTSSASASTTTSFCNNSNSTSNNNSSSSSRTLAEELAAKDKEIKTLIGEVTRLQALQESHIVQIQRLEERLEAKRQHILRLEARLEKQSDLEDVKKENSNLRSLDMSSPAVAAAAAAAAVATDAKQFQELLLERTKALAAAQNEALKSNSSSDGSTHQEPSKATASKTAVTTIATAIDKANNQIFQKSSTTTASTPNNNKNDTTTSSTNNKNNNSSIDLERESPPPSFTCENITSSSINVDNDINPEVTSKQHRKTNFRSDTSNTNHFNSSDALFKKPPRDNLNSPSHNKSMVQHFQNIEQFGTTFLDDDILNDWCRGGGFEFHPPSAPSTPQPLSSMMNVVANSLPSSTRPSTAPSTTSLLSQLVNSTFPNSILTDTSIHSAVNSHQDIDKASSHHETSSTASTPNLQDGRSTADEHLNGSCAGGSASGLAPMSLPMVKSPTEDNNNTLGPLPHVPTGFLPALPFQFQEHGRFRFAEDLQMPPGTMAGRLGDSLIPKGDPMEAKLQEMLRYNMDKYANQNLDTLHISRRVRELLSVHNIGQRLFAKYILGLSQGTVSELLSKPKPWDKLTEKGRDSYRKMHAWGCDDNAVLLLKSLIPKKGKDSGMPQYGRSDDSVSEDRIAHILSEASSLMKTPQGHGPPPHHMSQHQSPSLQQQHQSPHQQQQHQQHHQQQQHQHQQQQQQSQHHHQSSSGGSHTEDTHSNEDSKSPQHNQCPSPFYKDPMQRRMKKNENDELSQEKVARIYQEELAKLMSRSPRDAGFPSGGMPPAMNQMPDDNIRMALEAYHRELAKLQQTGGAIPNFPNLPGLLALQQHALNGAQDLSVPKEKSMKVNGQQNSSSSSIEQNDQNTKESTSSEDALRHSSAFSLVRPKQDSVGGPPVSSSVSTNPTPTAPSPLSNSILPPAITPTDDFSAAASPLQRMASITNSLITQAPVTPHHSTPQRPMKAVLPPITQQQFDMFNNLNTEDIVRRVKEALSQYSISQRLFGESVLGLSQGSVSDLLARPKPWHMLTQKGREPFIRMKMFLEDENAVHRLVASQYKIAPEKLMRTGNYSGSPQIPTSIGNKMVPMQKMMSDLKMDPPHLMQMQSPAMSHIPTSQHQGMLLTPPGMPPHHAISLPNPAEKKPMMMPVHSPQQNNAMRGMHQHMSPTVYEMAALTHDLDTQVITTKIKEALLANNIGQKIFGEAVLGLSQGSVSELLSKPKPWHMLSIKGREPFIRMQLWLSDANNVERLQAIKNERREASKRRRSTGPGTQDNSSDTSSNDTADFYTSSPGPGSVGSAGAPPNKKQRVLFSEEQKEALRLAFALDPYPNVATIEFLANELGLATRTITNWFHNHRMRLKQQVPHGAPSEPVPSRESQSGTPFDPVQFRILLNQRLMELQKERMGLTGVPLPYPPYFAANPNLAALIGRGLLPGSEPDLAALNNAFKEQMSGLDLSMSSLKREQDEDFEDVDGEADSHASDSASIDGSDVKPDLKDTPSSSFPATALQSRTSRRKPAAPQWVNPDWQDDAKTASAGAEATPLRGSSAGGANTNDQEVIINGVCVMQQQAADYSRKSSGEETVRVEPTPVQERFHDDTQEDDVASDNDDDVPGETESNISNKPSECGEVNDNEDNEPQSKVMKIKEEACESSSSRRSSIAKSGGLETNSETKEQDDDNDGMWNY